jgi:hypothetical protein
METQVRRAETALTVAHASGALNFAEPGRFKVG